MGRGNGGGGRSGGGNAQPFNSQSLRLAPAAQIERAFENNQITAIQGAGFLIARAERLNTRDLNPGDFIAHPTDGIRQVVSVRVVRESGRSQPEQVAVRYKRLNAQGEVSGRVLSDRSSLLNAIRFSESDASAAMRLLSQQ